MLSLDAVRYETTRRVASAVMPGVAFEIYKVSFGRRCELARTVREMMREEEFHAAGDSDLNRLESALLSLDIDRVYLRWGLHSVDGLLIDGQPAAPQDVYFRGPEELCREILAAIRAECGLSAEERKN